MATKLAVASLEARYTGGGRRGGSTERLLFQFNPTQLRERIRVDYGMTLPFQGSHEISTYTGTRSERIPLDLFYTVFDGKVSGAERRFPDLTRFPATDQTAESALAGPERFLKSLCYAAKDDAAPPTVVFDWPTILRMFVRVESLDIGFDHFDHPKLRGLTLVASMVLREELPIDHRLTLESVRQLGSVRAVKSLQGFQSSFVGSSIQTSVPRQNVGATVPRTD